MVTGGKADPDLQKQAKRQERGICKKMLKEELHSHKGIKQKVKRIRKKKSKNGLSLMSPRAKYQMHHGEDWWWKMNEVHDKLLEKLDESCCDDCITEQLH